MERKEEEKEKKRGKVPPRQLLVVILLPFYDCTRAIELLHEDEAHHLVGEREARERDLLVGTRIDRLGEAVGSSDGEDEAARRGSLLLQPPDFVNAPPKLKMVF